MSLLVAVTAFERFREFAQFAGQQPVCGDEPIALEVYAPAQMPLPGVSGV